jgi:hypothetical protein
MYTFWKRTVAPPRRGDLRLCTQCYVDPTLADNTPLGLRHAARPQFVEAARDVLAERMLHGRVDPDNGSPAGSELCVHQPTGRGCSSSQALASWYVFKYD